MIAAALSVGLLSSTAAIPSSAAAGQLNAPVGISPDLVNKDVLFAHDHPPIVARAKALIDASTPGSKIDMPLYYFNQQTIIDSLKLAKARGVNIRVLLDGHMRNQWQHTQLKAFLGEDKTKPSYVAVCGSRVQDGTDYVASRGCIGTRQFGADGENPSYALNHNKFITLTGVLLTNGSVAGNVTYISSANLDTYDAFQSAITVTDPKVHLYYSFYFADLEFHQSTTGNDAYNRRWGAASDTYQLFGFPFHEADGAGATSGSNDPIVNILRTENCAAGGSIKVANYRIQRTAVVAQLIAAAKRGCSVQVVTGNTGDDRETPDDETFDALKELASRGSNIVVRLCGSDPDFGGVPMHEKFMVIKKDASAAPQLLAGSANLTYKGLRQSDENVLRIRDAGIVSKYVERADGFYRICKGWTHG
ncbi:phospholipase D-like domain-containing protein [Amycolatopsis sp. YIM 10]|uniref:phospholipase D-like domain-containing protein n=1 Tax=Amycolatopsis sp. YIM 10 TaxID=2653857 RepID=UPI0012A8D933|nr:phospholipase D-like domain-containing protein [Amycolatopsis sp. YIM 10]QFU89652.1 hypothetical protein YIM_22370 [Amycolatopsis sp. YIM 10]